MTRSSIGRKPEQRATVRALGLGRIGSSVEQQASPSILGMVRSIAHLIRVEEIE